MKRLLCILFCVGILMTTPSWLAAQNKEAESFAVLPFQVHGPDKYQYLSEGIQSMLESRLAGQKHFVPVDHARVQITSAEIDSENRARGILEKLKAQYLFWGDVTILSDQASVDLNILKAQEPIRRKSWKTSLKDFLPSLQAQSKQVRQTFFNRQVEVAQSEDTEKEVRSGQQPSEKQIKQEREKKQNKVQESERSTSQPIQTSNRRSEQIVKTGSRDTYGRWLSQRLNFESKGAVVGDGDGDGENEVFILSKNKVYAFRKEGDRLEHITEYTTSRRLKCLNINLIELNEDKAPEIVVSAIQEEEKMQSFILQFSDSEFHVMQEGISRFLNVVSTPPEYEPVLLAQKFNPSRLFYGKIYKLRVDSKKVRKEKRYHLPNKVNVSNLAYLPLEDGYKLIFVGTFNKLRVMDQDGKVEYMSNEKYALSTTKLPKDTSLPGLGEARDGERYHYIPARLLPGDFNGDGNYELLVNRNISTMADLLPKTRNYPEGEIQSLYWDGVGLSQEWKTKTIQGTVIDYGIGDLDNDGNTKLYVCVNTYPGMTSLGEVKTILMTYSLEPIEDSAAGTGN